MAHLESKRFVLANCLGVDCPDLNVVHSGSDTSIDTITDDYRASEAAGQAPIGNTHEPNGMKGENEVEQPSHPKSLSVVSESSYRCIDESPLRSTASERYVIRNIAARIISSRFFNQVALQIYRGWY